MRTSQVEKQFLSVTEAAKRSGYSARTIRWWCEIEHLPSSRVGNSILISRAALDKVKPIKRGPKPQRRSP